jgi:hypothetical protein
MGYIYQLKKSFSPCCVLCVGTGVLDSLSEGAPYVRDVAITIASAQENNSSLDESS